MKRSMVRRIKPSTGTGQGGFTLLEVIVTIAIAAIMGVFFAQFVSTAVIHSADPVLRVQNLSRTTHIMENMTADYKRLATTQSNFLAIFKDFVTYGNLPLTSKPIGYEGYPYYGSYQVLYNDYIKFDSWEEKPDSTNQRVLKVTIRSGDQAVTALFTR